MPKKKIDKKSAEKKVEEDEGKITISPDSIEKKFYQGKSPKSVIIQEQIIASKRFSGPLPSPKILSQYKKISPSLYKKIVEMAVDEQKYRHKTEDKIIDAEIEDTKEGRTIEKRGQILAFLIGTIALIASTIIAISGKQITASIIGGGGIVSLVSVFILGRTMKVRDENGDDDDQSLEKDDDIE